MRRAHYTVVSHHRMRDFAQVVETLMEQGWTLVGGVSVFGHEASPTYHQALTRWEETSTTTEAPHGKD